MKINENAKKYLIYIRYLLPIIALIIIFSMLFVPSYRFIFSGKAGERLSTATLISNSWEQVRNILFATEEQKSPDLIFSRIVFSMIIAVTVLYVFAFAMAIWSAVVAFRCFLSDDEESAEKGRRLFIAFCPNRIVLFICNLAGLAIAVFPYCMRPIYGGVYSEHVVPVLEAPDSFGVGTLILALCGILSVISVIMEKKLDVDIFKKDKKTLEEEISELNSSESAEVDMNQEEVERIKNMFKKEKDNNK